nr:immunoglobulin light chain junction region [Macaca mulatta]
CLQTKNSPLTF